MKCIEQYNNFNFLKKIPHLHIYGNLCKQRHKITFLPINPILFIFKHSFSLHIFIRPFGTIIRQTKIGRASLFRMLSLVLIISYVFHCFFNLFMLLFFFLFHFFLQFNYFDSQNNHLNFKQDPITNVWSIFRKNDISICFVHKSQKWAIFGLTCKDKRSRDLVTIGPIFKFFFLKMRKTLKKKFSERRGAIHMRSRTIRKIVEGGGHNGPPPRPY